MMPGTMDRLCKLTVAASNSGADIIGAAHALYNGIHYLPAGTQLFELKRIKAEFAALQNAMPIVQDLIDELEGRKPPVKVDEQAAA